jgi:hypothetical protein
MSNIIKRKFSRVRKTVTRVLEIRFVCYSAHQEHFPLQVTGQQLGWHSHLRGISLLIPEAERGSYCLCSGDSTVGISASLWTSPCCYKTCQSSRHQIRVQGRRKGEWARPVLPRRKAKSLAQVLRLPLQALNRISAVVTHDCKRSHAEISIYTCVHVKVDVCSCVCMHGDGGRVKDVGNGLRVSH